MLVLISPSKSMNDQINYHLVETTLPVFGKDAEKIAKQLRKMSLRDLCAFLKVSEKLGIQNFQRYQEFSISNEKNLGIPAALSYSGEVYTGLHANQWNVDTLDYAQKHLRILSGLYGYLRPKDLIQSYRLEMASKINIEKSSNLYQFWKDKITKAISQEMASLSTKIIFNLTSDEYARAINYTSIQSKFITFEFYENRSGVKTFVSYSAKRARGLMANFIITNRIEHAHLLSEFNDEGYRLDEDASSPSNYVFVK